MAAQEVGTLGRCEAVDLVPTEDDARDVRCSRSGVLIREWTGHHFRLRRVCREHGYDPRYTPAVADA